MNIFVLDSNIPKCARYHADQHVVKMILEGTQMLCTVLNRNGLESPYRSTHLKHPCTIWAGLSLANWKWLRRLTLQLNEEFVFRYRKPVEHRSASVARTLVCPPIPDVGLTEFVQAMPDEYKVPGNPVQAYRNFYICEKSRFVRWTRRRQPQWFQEAIGATVQRRIAGETSRLRGSHASQQSPRGFPRKGS
jgi:hypothetical protein